MMMEEAKEEEMMGGRKRARAHHMGRSMSRQMI
jgi:hypothetical protein